MRAALYARYSSDQQSNNSIADQIRLCREHAEGAGHTVTETYSDAAISGAHAASRPGLQKLLADATLGRFDAVIAEALDRISRDQEHTAAIFKRLKFHGVELITLAEGAVDELHVGLKGTMNALFLKDLAAKTRRGQRGRVLAGRAPGGRAYGYAVVHKFDERGDPIRGLRRIDEDQAAIVRRIFGEYVGGRSPRAIAAGLNADGVPSPAGGKWNASTINGSAQRRNGILQNDIYAGRLTYNRVSRVRDPDTGRSITRPNPESEWTVVDASELRIVPEELWARAREIKAATSKSHPSHSRRPRHLLSGLIVCGVCGGPYTVRGGSYISCSRHREQGTCSNGQSANLHKIEARVMAGLKTKLLDAKYVEAFVAEYQAGLKARRRKHNRERRAAVRELARTEKAIARIVTAIEEGVEPRTVRERSWELEAERLRLSEAAQAELRDVVELHPGAADLYRRQVARLEEVLQGDAVARLEATAEIRALIHKVVVEPRPAGASRNTPPEIKLYGLVDAITAIANGGRTESAVKVVTPTRVGQYRTTRPTVAVAV